MIREKNMLFGKPPSTSHKSNGYVIFNNVVFATHVPSS